MNKKAITPMISTVLLIFFATGLGTLVMSWGASAEVHNVEVVIDGCSEATIKITEVAFERQVCVKDGMLYATIENNGVSDLNNLKAVLLTMASTGDQEIAMPIEAGGIERLEFIVGDEKILKARFIPIVEGKVCTERRIEIENIAECEDES